METQENAVQAAPAVTIETIRAAAIRAKDIVMSLVSGESDKPDVVAARRDELHKLTKDALIDVIVGLEKPKTDKGLSVVDVARAILTEEQCRTLSYEQVAAFCHQAIPTAKTTGKSIASIASKQGEELGFLPRIRIRLSELTIV